MGREFSLSRVKPALDLWPFIEHFWIVTWNLRKPYVSETLPFPSVHIVIEKGHREINGVLTSKFSRSLQGRGRAFGIKFRPGMFYPFLKSPVSELTDQVVSLRSIFGNEGSKLRKLVLEEEDIKKCIHHGETFFRTRLPECETSSALKIRDLIEEIAANRNITRVEQVALMMGLTLRPLQRAFQRHAGVSPKWVINRYRLQEAADMLANDLDLKMSDLALQLGYFDQAHFIRDFKSTIGKTPLEYKNGALKSKAKS